MRLTVEPFFRQPTRRFALLFLATVIGFSVTLILKVLILTQLRKKFHNGFFRGRPASSNFLGLMLDCWYLGLSSGYMVMRALQLILIAVLNIGRIDRPILADGKLLGYQIRNDFGLLQRKLTLNIYSHILGVANVGPVILDSYPISFRKDLLQHEVRDGR